MVWMLSGRDSQLLQRVKRRAVPLVHLTSDKGYWCVCVSRGQYYI